MVQANHIQQTKPREANANMKCSWKPASIHDTVSGQRQQPGLNAFYNEIIRMVDIESLATITLATAASRKIHW
jgi:hypothetical protein